MAPNRVELEILFGQGERKQFIELGLVALLSGQVPSRIGKLSSWTHRIQSVLVAQSPNEPLDAILRGTLTSVTASLRAFSAKLAYHAHARVIYTLGPGNRIK